MLFRKKNDFLLCVVLQPKNFKKHHQLNQFLLTGLCSPNFMDFNFSANITKFKGSSDSNVSKEEKVMSVFFCQYYFQYSITITSWSLTFTIPSVESSNRIWYKDGLVSTRPRNSPWTRLNCSDRKRRTEKSCSMVRWKVLI